MTYDSNALDFDLAKSQLQSFMDWRDRYFPYKDADLAIRIVLFLARHSERPVTHKKLYRSLPCTQPTATHWTSKLESEGYIHITQSALDRRVSELTLTGKGIEAVADLTRMTVRPE